MSLRTTFDSILQEDSPLEHLDAWIWESLEAGSSSSRHPWNVGYFSTVEVDDSGAMAPRSRTVILRAANGVERSIDFYTDVRSTKVEQLRFDGGSEEVCWLFYSPTTKLQLRLEGVAGLIGGDEAEQAWERTPVQSRAAYVSLATPGIDFDSERPPDTSDRIVSERESERGRDNFQIVRTCVRVADILYLRREGHVRARADYVPSGDVSTKWIVP